MPCCWPESLPVHLSLHTVNSDRVAVEFGLVAEEDHFGWLHRFRHSLSTWANDRTKDITVSQTMLRHAKPDITATIYTHGNFWKALDAQRMYMEQLLRMKSASESNQ